MKNVGKLFGTDISSLGGVHLISGIAQLSGLIAIKYRETLFPMHAHVCEDVQNRVQIGLNFNEFKNEK